MAHDAGTTEHQPQQNTGSHSRRAGILENPQGFDHLLWFRITRQFQSVFGQQGEERIVGIGCGALREGEESLVEAGPAVFHFLRRPAAIHAQQGRYEGERNRRSDSKEQQETARQQAGRGKRHSDQDADNQQREPQRGDSHGGCSLAPGKQPETLLQPVQILRETF